MSDRLDDKITAFVVELLDDPPPAPDIDADAARRAQRIEPKVPRFRPRNLAVAAAAFMAVMVAGGVIALVPWSGDGEPFEPIGTVPTTVTGTVPATAAPPDLFPPLQPSELLTTNDLPPDLAWQVFDEATHEGDSINGWNIAEHGIIATRCDGLSLTWWKLDPSPRSFDLDRPWVRLDDSLLRAMYEDTAVFGEAVYAGTPDAVKEAFEEMAKVTSECGEGAFEGYASGGDVARLAMPAFGDESIAIKVKAYLSRSKTRYDIFRLAVVRAGTRLLIVEEHETVQSRDNPHRVSDAEFTAVVQAAVDRLET